VSGWGKAKPLAERVQGGIEPPSLSEHRAGGIEGAGPDIALVEIETDGDHASSREWNRDGVPRVAVQRRAKRWKRDARRRPGASDAAAVTVPATEWLPSAP
jgi:hypothetical protein